MNEEIIINDDLFITYDRNKLLDLLKEHNIKSKDRNELLNLIENYEEDEENVFLKVSYHLRYFNSVSVKETIEEIIERFSVLMESYSIYRGYESSVKWAEDYNDEFEFINFNDYEDIYDFFDTDLKDSFISELKANVDLGELENSIDKLNLKELLKTLQEKGILEDLPFSISPYIYWEGKVRKLGNYGFNIEYWPDDIIIVEK